MLLALDGISRWAWASGLDGTPRGHGFGPRASSGRDESVLCTMAGGAPLGPVGGGSGGTPPVCPRLDRLDGEVLKVILCLSGPPWAGGHSGPIPPTQVLTH